jgi:tetratricopeptide (TPR) repeat protein
MRTLTLTLALLPLLLSAQEKPAALLPGTGVWKHPIATKSPEAQRFFDQGLNQLYGFNRYEALRDFRKAAELDPAAPMPHWGIAMAAGPYINMDGEPTYDMKVSCAAVDAGLKLQPNPRERAYLETARSRCPDFSKPGDYVAAARALAQRWPDDLDAQTFYADALMIPPRWHWYTADGAPAPGVADAERTLEAVLRRWPDHPGANHLYIHAVESSPTPERAVPSAQRLMGITPSEGHMVHMPGHIWLVLGEWELAAGVNERAAEVDRQYFAATGVTDGPYPMYYAHNLHFILYARSMQGRRADALKAADTLAAAVAPMAEAMPEMAEVFEFIPKFALLRFNEWDKVLALRKPKDVQKISTALWHFARTLAYAGKKDKTAAAKERAEFESARKAVKPDADWGQSKAAPVLEMAAEILAAKIQGDEIAHLTKAVAIQDAFTYDEPPAWYYPLRESLGVALLRAGNAGEAEKIFREGARRIPKNGRMLFGLMQSLKAQNKQEESTWVQKEYEAAWSKADVKLTLEEM